MDYNYDSMTQEELRELAIKPGPYFVKFEAVKRLNDQEALKQVALNDHQTSLAKEIAVKKLLTKKH